MILSCGEALIDMLPRATVAGEAVFLPCPGGAVFNTSVALGRLGVPSAFFSGISTDLFGEMLIRALTTSQVEISLAARSDLPTTLAFVTLTGGEAAYAFYDENTAGRMLDEAGLPELSPEIRALFFGGISLVSEPAASTYEALQARAAQTRLIMLDPNIRPGFIAGRETATRARLMRMIARSDIVKLSADDLRWLEGDGDPGAQARGILTCGPKLVFLTEGASGARAFSAAHECHLPAPGVAVADTVGAGDTFNAGILAALHEAGALSKAAVAAADAALLERCLDLGCRAAAVTVSRPGADPPWRHELEENR